MKIQGFKYALWAINFVIVVGIGLATTLLIVGRGKAIPNVSAELDKLQKDILAKRSATLDERVSLKECEAIWNTQVRAKLPEPEKTAEEKQAEKGPQATTPLDRQIQLAGFFGTEAIVTYLEPTPGAGAAKPTPKKDKENNPLQRYVTINTPVPDIRPEARPVRFESTPYPGGVVFDYDKKEVRLPILRDTSTEAPPAPGVAKKGPGGFSPAGAMPPTGRVPGGSRPGRQDQNKEEGEGTEPQPPEEELTEARESRPGEWEIPGAEREMLQERAREMLDQIGTEDYSEGPIKGIKLSNLGDSLASQRGFQDGDIVKSINGVQIKSQTDLIDFAKKQGNTARAYTVEILRQGKTMRLTYRFR